MDNNCKKWYRQKMIREHNTHIEYGQKTNILKYFKDINIGIRFTVYFWKLCYQNYVILIRKLCNFILEKKSQL